MYTEEQFIELEQSERQLTDEEIAVMLIILADMIGDVKTEITKFYQKYGKDGVVTYSEARKWIGEQDHRRRLTALNLVISGKFNSAYNEMKPIFKRMLESVVDKETTFFDVQVDKEKTLDTKWGSDNSTWSQRLEDDINLWTIYILNDIKQSILKRKDINSVLDLIDERHTSMTKILKKLGLTESTAIGSIARHKIFKGLGISQYQFYTKVDERRCETCGSMHGHVFPISAYEVGVTASPLHPHCRCWEVPII
jgi:SPP1 gp7 family putative phage head morphogenesis protein